MTSCITQSLLELKLVNGSGEVSAGRTRGNVMRRGGRVANTPSSFLPYERIISWHVEKSGWVTVGLISWHGFHHSGQFPPVTTAAGQLGNIWKLRVTHSEQAQTGDVCVDAPHDSGLTSSPTTASSSCPWRCFQQTPATSTPPACRWRAAWPQWWAPVSGGSWSPFLKTTAIISLGLNACEGD